MPGRREAPPVDPSLCRRCQDLPPTITVRAEPLCSACFCRYVNTKAVKRLESFRVRRSGGDAERTLLLPLSLGHGSVTLLHVLSERLKGQLERTGRKGFEVRVVIVDDGSIEEGWREVYERVKRRWSQFEYDVLSLSDFVSSDQGVRALFTAPDDGESNTSSSLFDLDSLLSSLKTPTQRADALQILRRRSVVGHAKRHHCDSILWGDSTTRLAERTLAETAKGRGFALPWLISDGSTPQDVPFHYPLRDLLRKEILAFTSMVEPALTEVMVEREVRESVSTRNTSIDELMRGYFEGVEVEYPSIVANVVRTTGKLEVPAVEDEGERCELCELPLSHGRAPESSRVCWGCIRTVGSVG